MAGVVPIWVGTGLLAPIALGMPLGVGVQGMAGGSPITADNGPRGWVYAIVYTGFTFQAVLLLTAFVLYARTRWASVFLARTRDLAATAIGPGRLARVAALVATGHGVTHLAWAVSGGALGGDPAAVSTFAQKTFWVVPQSGSSCCCSARSAACSWPRWGCA